MVCPKKYGLEGRQLVGPVFWNYYKNDVRRPGHADDHACGPELSDGKWNCELKINAFRYELSPANNPISWQTLKDAWLKDGRTLSRRDSPAVDASLGSRDQQ